LFFWVGFHFIVPSNQLLVVILAVNVCSVHKKRQEMQPQLANFGKFCSQKIFFADGAVGIPNIGIERICSLFSALLASSAWKVRSNNF
jgi:hypothetical protein